MKTPPHLFFLATAIFKVQGFQSTSPRSHHHHHGCAVISSTFQKTTFFSTPTGDIQAETTQPTTLTTLEIQAVFKLLANTTLLYDPSRGTCCRTKCSGCSYSDGDGNFKVVEYTADDEYGGWLAPYVKVDFCKRVHTSRWSELIFPPNLKSNDSENNSQQSKEVERTQFVASLLEEPETSPLAIQSLWNLLSPSPGYPRLSSTEITRAIKGMEGSMHAKGGAVDYTSFEKSMMDAADQIIQLGVVETD